MSAKAPNRYVDVTESLHRKLAALRSHESQTAHMTELDTMIRGWLTMNATAAGLPEGRLAEAFMVVSTA